MTLFSLDELAYEYPEEVVPPGEATAWIPNSLPWQPLLQRRQAGDHSGAAAGTPLDPPSTLPQFHPETIHARKCFADGQATAMVR